MKTLHIKYADATINTILKSSHFVNIIMQTLMEYVSATCLGAERNNWSENVNWLNLQIRYAGAFQALN